ncbi:MAG: hypothetical protein PHX47_03680, partial [Candidatus ainarchaeum sp.]|nr:hypothetical protein [Candidatus ainarchaeum sp.]
VVLPLTATINTPDASDVYNLSEGIYFDVSVSNAIGTKSYQWQFNRNSTGWTNFGSNSYTTTNGFATGGTYEFRVLVTDSSRPSPINQVYSDTVGNILISDPLAVSVTSPTTGTIYSTSATPNITFNSSVSNAVSGVSSYVWEYSLNGTSSWIVFGSSVSNPSYNFTSAGTKYIRVTVTDGAGRTATSSNINVVIESPPIYDDDLDTSTGWSTHNDISWNPFRMSANWDSGPGLAYRGLTTEDNIVITAIVAPSADMGRAGILFNLGSTSAYYTCYIRYNYEQSGAWFYYGGSKITSADVDGSWKINSGQYYMKISSFGSSKKCKYWEVGDPEPANWLYDVTHSTRNSGQWGAYVTNSGRVYSMIVNDYG